MDVKLDDKFKDTILNYGDLVVVTWKSGDVDYYIAVVRDGRAMLQNLDGANIAFSEDSIEGVFAKMQESLVIDLFQIFSKREFEFTITKK